MALENTLSDEEIQLTRTLICYCCCYIVSWLYKTVLDKRLCHVGMAVEQSAQKNSRDDNLQVHIPTSFVKSLTDRIKTDTGMRCLFVSC